jgi:hypothetical protein
LSLICQRPACPSLRRLRTSAAHSLAWMADRERHPGGHLGAADQLRGRAVELVRGDLLAADAPAPEPATRTHLGPPHTEWIEMTRAGNARTHRDEVTIRAEEWLLRLTVLGFVANQAGSKQSGSTTRGRTTTACRPFHPERKSADRRRAGQTAKPVSEPTQEVQCEAQSLSLGFPSGRGPPAPRSGPPSRPGPGSARGRRCRGGPPRWPGCRAPTAGDRPRRRRRPPRWAATHDEASIEVTGRTNMCLEHASTMTKAHTRRTLPMAGSSHEPKSP